MSDRDTQFYKHLEMLVQDELQRRLEVEKKQKEQEKILIQQSKMAAMGEMLGVIAHQWKQPLNTISIISGMMEMRITEDDNMSKEEMVKQLKEIQEQVKFMSETMNEFRSFFKPSRAKKVFYLSEIVDDMEILMGKYLRTSDIEISKNISDKKIPIFGFKNELIQVLINLISNASDVMKERDVKSKIIFIEIFKSGEYGMLCVEDSGGGVSKEVLERVFEPYFSTKGDAGTGIGLSLSKMIIKSTLKGR